MRICVFSAMICGRVEAVLLTKKLKVVTVRLGLDAFGTAAEGVIRAFGENIDLSEVSFVYGRRSLATKPARAVKNE